MTSEEHDIVAKAYEILCKQADKERFTGHYLQFPINGKYDLFLGKKLNSYEEHKRWVN